jgi:hypothetical protein
MPNFLTGTINPSGPTQATVNQTTTSLVSANTDRQGLIIINVSASTISLGLGADAILNQGITLGSLGVWNMAEYDFTTAVINGIASSTAQVAIQEFVR